MFWRKCVQILIALCYDANGNHALGSEGGGEFGVSAAVARKGGLTMATGAIGRIPMATKLDRLMTPTDTGFPTDKTPNDTDAMLMSSVHMWELQYLSSSEKSLSKRTALKKRAITHSETTHVMIVDLF